MERHSSASQQQQPTLLSLLHLLASDRFTIPEQRQQIRHIVTEFLANEVPHHRVYHLLGQVIGHELLQQAMNLLRDPTSLDAKIENVDFTRRRFAGPLFPTDEDGTSKSLAEVLRISKLIPLPNSHSPIASWGHRALSIDGTIFILSGAVAAAPQDRPGFQRLTVVRQKEIGFQVHQCTGELPPPDLQAYSLNLQYVGKDSPRGILYGGRGATTGCLNGDIYIFDFMTRIWEKLAVGDGGTRPPSREAHSARCWPSKSEFRNVCVPKLETAPCENEARGASQSLSSDEEVLDTEYLIIFGGRTFQSKDGGSLVPQILGDLWIFAFATQSWTLVHEDEVSLRPCARFGHSMTVLNDEGMFLIYGGERQVAGVTEVVADPWTLTLEIERLKEEIETATPQCKISADFRPALCRARPPTIAHYTALHLMVDDHNGFLSVGGMSQEDQKVPPRDIGDFYVIYAKPIPPPPPPPTTESQTPVTTDPLPDCSRLSPRASVHWAVVDARYRTDTSGLTFSARQQAAAGFFELETPWVDEDANQPRICPSAYIHGGLSSEGRKVFQGSWILSLNGLDCLHPEDTAITGGTVPSLLVGRKAAAEVQPIAGASAFAAAVSSAASPNPSLPSHIAAQVPAWVSVETHAPGLLWPLGGICHWAFTPIGHFMENSIGAKSTRFDVQLVSNVAELFESLKRPNCVPSTEEAESLAAGMQCRGPVIIVVDNGAGVAYHTMHKLLKRYGTADAADSLAHNCGPGPSPQVNGLGFKLAVSRLCGSALVLTRTKHTIGVGLLSQTLMATTSAKCTIAPVCYWSCETRCAIENGLPGSDHRQSQRLLMRHSPFRHPRAIAYAVASLGEGTGTKIFLWDLRADVCNLFRCSQRHQTFQSWLQPSLTQSSAPPMTVQTCLYSKFQANDFSRPLELEEPTNEEAEADVSKEPEINANFPLWTDAADSPDFSLATYAFWSRLHNHMELRVDDRHLVSKRELEEQPDSSSSPRDIDPEPSTTPGDTDPERYKHSLYRFLKGRLHRAADLSYLFQPSDAADNCHGLIGFLNDPLNPPTTETRVCEAGIMLFHKERLICRLNTSLPSPPECINAASNAYLESHFKGSPRWTWPCTAVINVPDWMIPNVSCETFLVERTGVWHLFMQKLERLMKRYLSLVFASGDVPPSTTEGEEESEAEAPGATSLSEWLQEREEALTTFVGKVLTKDRKTKLSAVPASMESREEAAKRRAVAQGDFWRISKPVAAADSAPTAASPV